MVSLQIKEAQNEVGPQRQRSVGQSQIVDEGHPYCHNQLSNMYVPFRSSGQVNEEQSQNKNSANILIIDETSNTSTSNRMATSTALPKQQSALG